MLGTDVLKMEVLKATGFSLHHLVPSLPVLVQILYHSLLFLIFPINSNRASGGYCNPRAFFTPVILECPSQSLENRRRKCHKYEGAHFKMSFGFGYDGTSGGEGPEDFVTAVSHFSDDSSDDGQALALESKANSSRLLSEGENERLNANIDSLLGALASGREVHFDQDPVTGVVDVTAENTHQTSEKESDDDEAQIAAWPENFGHIITHRRQMIRSPNSIQNSWSSTDSLPQAQYDSLEEALAAIDEHFDRRNRGGGTGTRQTLPEAVGIRQVVRYLEKEAGDPRGSRLARIDSTEVEIDQIYPIPLDYNKVQREKTPTVQEEGSELERSSPLFVKSHKQMKQYGEDWSAGSSSNDSRTRLRLFNRVSAWLDRVESPERISIPEEFRRRRRAFGVLKDAPDTGAETNPAKPTGLLPSKMLKDVSNLRQPGYLEQNSFAVDKTREVNSKPPRSTRIPAPQFGRALDAESRRAYINTKWPGLLANQIDGIGTGAVTIQETSAEPPFDQDPERAAHFELALARLEGRVLPEPSSPIQRFVHLHGAYGSDVEVDLRPVRYRQPRPRRYAVGNLNLAQRFEQMLAEGRIEDIGHRGAED